MSLECEIVQSFLNFEKFIMYTVVYCACTMHVVREVQPY